MGCDGAGVVIEWVFGSELMLALLQPLLASQILVLKLESVDIYFHRFSYMKYYRVVCEISLGMGCDGAGVVIEWIFGSELMLALLPPLLASQIL
jgi:hypothetical protein